LWIVNYEKPPAGKKALRPEKLRRDTLATPRLSEEVFFAGLAGLLGDCDGKGSRWRANPVHILTRPYGRSMCAGPALELMPKMMGDMQRRVA